MSKFTTVLIAASALFAAPAFAQNDANIVLRVDSGTVLSSTGGEYQAANTGKPLAVGEKIMVNAGSSATALFDGGCMVSFSQPGVYSVPAECKGTRLSAGQGSGALIIAGAAIIGAAALDQMDKEDVGPLSNGIPHI
ncbi:MAG: hypothetical protein EOP18_06825 [Rhizobiaceae bacterium]|nr:MAG: hypothetical protein EOP18_06825 [Rhizobiaceae bacterium]